jgi:hypothetical protein
MLMIPDDASWQQCVEAIRIRMTTNESLAPILRAALRMPKRTRTSGAVLFEGMVGL